MVNLGQGRSHKGLGVVISVQMLLNINPFGYRGRLTVLAFLLGLSGRHFFKNNPRLRIPKAFLRNLRLLTGISLGVFY